MAKEGAVGKVRKFLWGPPLWGTFMLVISLIFTILVSFREKVFVEENQISVPQVSLEFPIAYFFGAVVVIGVVLFLVPVSKLKYVFQVLFSGLFGWGVFIIVALLLPVPAAVALAVIAALSWLFQPRLWLHNLLLLVTLMSVGVVFGFILSPWTAVILMLVIAVYDALAVRFGYMMWMAKRMSALDTLPAFLIPASGTFWNFNLKGSAKEVFSDAPEREFSLLGGGDIGFPLVLAVSVFFAYGLGGAIIVAVFSMLGLLGAYGIQATILKGKPTPALPPIAVLSLIGFLITAYAVY